MANQDFRVKNGLQVGRDISSAVTVGIGTTTAPTSNVDIQGTVSATGTITAPTFAGTATTANNLSDAANITTGTISADRLSGNYNISITGSVSDSDSIGVKTATIDNNLNVGAGNTGLFADADGQLLVTGIATFKDNVILDSINSIQIPAGTTEERGFRLLETKTGNVSGVGTNRITGIDTTGIEVDQYILGPSGVLRENTQVESIGIGSIGIGLTALSASSGGTFRFGSVGLVTGQIRYNTTDSTFEGYGPGGQWGSLGGVKDIDRDTYITAQNDLAVDDDTLRFYTNGTEKTTINSDGNVGIGSTLPTAKLDINGTLNVSGTSTFASDVDISTNLTVDGLSDLDELNVSGIATFQNDVIIENKFQTTTDGFKVLNGTSETAVISGPQNIILDPSPDDVVAITTGAISSAGVSTITGITTTNIAVGNLIQEVDGIISTGTTVTSVGVSQVGISKTSLGDTTNQEFTFVNQTPTGIVRIKGDLYVDGTRTEINSTTLTVDDLNVVVASGATNSMAADGAGLTVDGANATFQYAHTGTKWVANKSIEATSFIKNGGASTEFLKADGSVDTNTYLTSFSESDTLDSVTTRGSTTTNNIGVGNITATKFVKSGGQSTQFLKADGSVDTNTYLTTESDTLDSVTTRGSTTTNNIGVGTITATKFVKDGGVSTEFLKADGSVDTNTYLTSYTESQTLDDVLTLGNVSDIGLSVGVVTATSFYGDASGLRGLKSTELVSYASASDISNSALSISGISTYNEVGILTGAHATVGDTFGYSVATSADGKTIIVGAYDDEIPGILDNSGVVYVYDREGNNFNEVGILSGSYATNNNDNFGYSVATSADGKTIIVGARSDETSGTTGYGLVYVFDREGNNFNEVGILTGSYASQSSDRFGHSVATSADGKTIIVGAVGDETSGTTGYGLVYVFDREGNNFNEVGILTGSYASSNDNFGHSVATSADGKTIIVGAYGDGTSGSNDGGLVYVYDREGNNFNEVGILTGTYVSQSIDNFGESVATSADGKTIIVGAGRDEINPSGIGTYGLLYVYDREGNNFNQVGILTGSYASDSGDGFGKSFAISADGKTIAVAATQDETSGTGNYGLVYVFNREGNNFNEVGILTGTYSSESLDLFGHSVATSADGKTIIVGAYKDEIVGDRTGVVYVYDQERETYVFSDVNGNIGIGSAQPTAKLDVNGTVKATLFDGNATSASVASSITVNTTSDTSAYPLFVSESTGGNRTPFVDSDIYYNTSNNTLSVGIITGTTSTFGTVNATSKVVLKDGKNLEFGDASNGDVKVFYDGTANDLEIELESAATQIAITNEGIYKHIITKDGKVGINTSVTPTSELEVYGDTYISGNIGIGSTQPTAKLDVNGTLNVSGITTLGVTTATDITGQQLNISGIITAATVNAANKVSVGNHSIETLYSAHTASAGIASTIDTFATSAHNFAEYTIHVTNNSNIQTQKVLVMHDGDDAYSQEYAIMYNPSKIVSISATISGGNVLLQATPETGISGAIVYTMFRSAGY